MSLRILLIAAAALICHCAADVAHINHAAPKDVLVPFNDLLPPPLEESTTESAVPATKPTKKSFHQQQQQQARSKVSDISAEKPAVLQLAVDLLPPFADADSGSSTSTTTSTTTRQPLVSIKGASTTAPRVAQPVQQHARTNSLGSETSASSRFSAELIRQYATYFQSTTPRPPRGPLPTLTPFPRFIKN
ncbi:hypothetical protein AWZ03_005570 [Drosophila navojoa]|uniref:DUF4794 domain-containing protein n=1 Tax=Drosophila navojoa TaxID=7232 RepID=A0A484BI68_DRONA|nr:uncharacterized protein LOC108651357 isoform X1 [Drosophila navojoa]TDG47952.1 hypothetical protein AWZ03_005570 [Drosophila navojoa]